MSSPEERLRILKAETARLEQYLSNLPKEAWNQPSACGEWTVADVVAHLTVMNHMYPTRIIEALQADTSQQRECPPQDSGKVDPAPVAHRAIALTNELGDQLLPTFMQSNRDIEAALAQVGPEDWDTLVHRPNGAEPLRNIVDVLISERVIHGWDIMSPVDPDVQFSPACIPIIIERMPQRPRWWEIQVPTEGLSAPVRYRLQVSDVSVPGTDFILAPDRQYMEVAGDVPADVTFHCDGETFALLAYGRLRPEAAISRGKLTYQGDKELADMFIRSFVGG